MPDELTPVTNIEKFLAKTAGEAVDLPEPVTRIEKYLNKISSEQSIISATDNWLDEHIDPDTGYALDTTLTLANAAAPAKTVGDALTAQSEKIDELKTALNMLAWAGDEYEPIKSWVTKTSNAVTNNGDGTYTIGTTDYGTIIFEALVLPPGIYRLYGVPTGFSFLSTTTNYSSAFVTNNTTADKEVVISTETACYLGYRNTVRPSSSYTITPYLKKDRISTADDKILKIDNDITEMRYSENVEGFPLPFTLISGSGINYGNGNTSSSSVYSHTDYIDVSEFKQIRYKATKTTASSTSIGIAFYNASKTYVSGISETPNKDSVGYLEPLYFRDVPDNAVYARFTTLTDAETYGDFEAYGVSNIVYTIDEINSNLDYSVDINEFNYKNLVGMEGNVYYPVNMKQQETTYLIMSTADGNPINQSDLIITGYDAEKSLVTWYNFSSSSSFRRITFPQTVKYLAWNKAPAREVQVEFGTNPTYYVPYHYPIGKRLAQIESDAGSYIARGVFNGEPYEGIYDWQTPVANYGALFKNKINVESFAFFTDPHVMGFGDSVRNELKMHEYIKKTAKVLRSVPCKFSVCGGDWLNNSTTMDEACYRLGYIKALANNMLCDCKLVIGNHDTNYQGKLNTESENGTGRLTDATIAALMFNDTETRKAYYSFDGIRSKCYVLDSGIEHSTMLAYDWEQVAWLAGKLAEDDPEHAVIFLHIITNNGDVQTNATNFGTLVAAFNSHTTVTLNSVSYDFTSCTGHVDFWVAGHTHIDSNGTLGGIPYFITASNSYDSDVPLIELVLADYDNSLLYLKRVGSTGDDRTISLTTGNLVT